MVKVSKSGPNSKVKVSGYPQKALVTRNVCVKYQSYSTHFSKFISKVKVFKKYAKLLGQGQRLKKCWYMKNIIALVLTIQKLLAR